MIFIDNKYTRWYYNIVNLAKQRNNIDESYLESHHIIPDCFFENRNRKGPSGWLLGDPDDSNNIVKLTAKEHFICHLLLTKMISGKPKYQMIQAATAFAEWVTKNHKRDHKITARTYSLLKKQRSDSLKNLWENDENYRNSALAGLKRLSKDSAHKERMSKLRKALWNDPEYLAKMNARPIHSKKVKIHGIEYESLVKAGIALGVTANCVSKRCTNPKFTEWIYA